MPTLSSNFYDIPRLAMTTKECNRDIDETTTDLTACVERMVAILNKRARLFATCAKFDSAILDAETMQAVMPHSPLGYQCAGEVYVQQGRQQAAMEEYAKALANISKGEHPDLHIQLMQAKAKAEQQQSKRIDFICELPFDIVLMNILPRITACKDCTSTAGLPWPYLDVSRAWQHRILRHYRQAAVDRGLGYEVTAMYDPESKGFRQFARFAPYVSNIVLGRGVLRPFYEACRRTQLDRIKRVTIKGACINEENERVSSGYNKLFGALRSVGKTLTHLSLAFDISSNPTSTLPIQVLDILDSCPHLVSLELVECAIQGVPPVMPDTTSHSELKALCIRSDYTTTSYTCDDLLAILKRCPLLHSLTICPCYESRALVTIQDLCPSLQHLCYGTDGLHLDFIPAEDNSITTSDLPPTSSLQSLYIESGGESYHQDDVVAVLERNHKTLQRLHFSGVLWNANGPDSTFSNPQQRHHTFEQLQFLKLNYVGNITFPFCAWILRSCCALTEPSRLKELTLQNISISDNCLLNPLKNTSLIMGLEKLRMQLNSDSDVDALQDLLSYHVRSSCSGLRELSLVTYKLPFSSVSCVHDHLLEQVSLLKNIKHVKIFGDVVEQGLLHLLGCKTLSSLVLSRRVYDSNVQMALQEKIPNFRIVTEM